MALLARLRRVLNGWFGAAIIRRERQVALFALGEYRRYRQRVAMLLPWLF
ncbi:MAG TPA: hypothetical protein VM715_06010 [Candidatus Acidoferrum sp.]|nr:hypothetical protein [Candidatus Acidoferrum sp.]